MRIALIINSLEGGGAERVASTLAGYFHGHGHELTIVTLHGGRVAYSLPSDVKVHPLASRRLMRSVGRVSFLPLAAFELASVLDKIAPDAAISFLTRSNLTHVMTRAFGNRRPIYISERVFSEVEYVGHKRLLGEAVKRLYPRADHVVAISEGVRESLGRMGVPLGKITTIHNPQDLDAIKRVASEVQSRARAPGIFTVVMAGRLTRQKDYPAMLDAVAMLKRRSVDVHLVVLGEGPDRAKLEERTHELGIEDRVEWRGWVSNATEVMAGADAFALTSLYEGFGNVLVEAMACGVPVITTDCTSGPAEIVDQGRYGFLVPVSDFVAIADAIEALICDPSLRKEYAQRAREGAERFDVKATGQRYLDVLGGSVVIDRKHATNY